MLNAKRPTELERDANYESMIKYLEHEAPEGRTKRTRDMKTKDYQRSLRTRVVLSWIMSNLLLIFIVLHTRSGGLQIGNATNNSGVYLSVGKIDHIIWCRLIF